MDLNVYQQRAISTAAYPEEFEVVYPALGLTGEAGEVADKIKKVIRDGTELDFNLRNEIMKEVGDVLWYVAVLSRDLGFTLEHVADYNLAKLADRKARNVIQGSGDNR